jgi:hypothetical protein
MFFKITTKKQWSKGAHVAPYSMVGPIPKIKHIKKKLNEHLIYKPPLK